MIHCRTSESSVRYPGAVAPWWAREARAAKQPSRYRSLYCTLADVMAAGMKKSQETQKRVDEAVISAKGIQRVRDGHLWIYRSDVTSRPKVESGSVVRVTDNRGRFVAWAHYGAESEIT